MLNHLCLRAVGTSLVLLVVAGCVGSSHIAPDDAGTETDGSALNDRAAPRADGADGNATQDVTGGNEGDGGVGATDGDASLQTPNGDAGPGFKDDGGTATAGAMGLADCGMLPCFEHLYPHSPLLATVPSNPPLDPNDRTLVDSLFHRPDGLRASNMGGTFPLYSSGCSDPGYVVGIGQPSWLSNQPAGQTVHFPRGAVPQAAGDAHITVFDSCPATYGVWDFWASSTPSKGAINAQTGTRVPAYSVPVGCTVDKAHYSECVVDGLHSAEGHGQFASAAGIRGQEVLNGSINHAMLLDTMCSAPGNGIFPAAQDAPDAPCPYNNDSGPHARYGQRFYLALTTAQIDALFPAAEAWKKPYWVALAKYGAYVSDTGWVTTQREANNGYTALGKKSPWDTLAKKYGWNSSGGDYQTDFAPNDGSAWNTIYENIHAISVDAPAPMAP